MPRTVLMVKVHACQGRRQIFKPGSQLVRWFSSGWWFTPFLGTDKKNILAIRYIVKRALLFCKGLNEAFLACDIFTKISLGLCQKNIVNPVWFIRNNDTDLWGNSRKYHVKKGLPLIWKLPPEAACIYLYQDEVEMSATVGRMEQKHV